MNNWIGRYPNKNVHDESHVFAWLHFHESILVHILELQPIRLGSARHLVEDVQKVSHEVDIPN